jgi:tRNA threonylcarbamoyladenosine biosynthesis protein TsaB
MAFRLLALGGVVFVRDVRDFRGRIQVFRMNILALDTSTEYCSVALWQDGAVLERSELAGQKHSEILIEMLDALLNDAGVKLAQIDGIAFGKGPGSFTGVRIACGATQGLAFGANLPVAGICTLEALAEASGRPRVIAALDARMGEIYHAAYEKLDDAWTTVIEPCLCKPEEAPKVSGDNWFGAGSGFATHGNALAERYAGQLLGIDAGMVPQAAAIAALGAAQFAAGRGVDAAQALPLYLRNKVALKTSERVPR